MRYQALVLDLDGTLINSLGDISNAMNGALAEYGLPGWRTDDYRYLVGNGARKLAERAVRDRKDQTEAVLQSYQRRYEKHCEEETAPYAGMPEALAALTGDGIRLCVLSNKPDPDTKHIVAHFFPGIPFAAVQGQVEGIPVKPDPTGARMLADRLGLQSAECLYLGDTAVDMTCAVGAGMTPLGALWGFRTEEELRENGAGILVERPADLPETIRGLNRL